MIKPVMDILDAIREGLYDLWVEGTTYNMALGSVLNVFISVSVWVRSLIMVSSRLM